MRAMLRSAVCAVALSFALVPGAQAQVSSDFLAADNPSRVIPTSALLTVNRIYAEGGAWYNPAQSGSGWYFSALTANPETPLMTGAFFGYEQNGSGRAKWYVTGGAAAPRFDPALAPLFRGEALATWEAPLFEGNGGACPTCAYSAPAVTPSSLGTVRLRFMTPSDARVEINGREVAPITHADMTLQNDLYARLLGFHRGFEQSWTLRSISGDANAIQACRFDFRPANNPAPGNVWEAGAGVPSQSLPHPSARWLKIWRECAPTGGVGPTTMRDTQIFVAVAPAGISQVAVAIQVEDVAGQSAPTVIGNAAGNRLGYRLEGRSLTARIFSSGPNEVTYAGRLNHDTRSLDRVMTMSR